MPREPFRETLTGLRVLGVHVEPLDTDAERCGLTADDLRADVESKLAGAGLTIVPPPKLFNDVLGAPFLHLDVMTLEMEQRYAYSVRLELWQAVRLVREPVVQTMAVTWRATPLIGTVAAGALVGLRQSVASVVDQFITDRQAPAPTSERSRSLVRLHCRKRTPSTSLTACGRPGPRALR